MAAYDRYAIMREIKRQKHLEYLEWEAKNAITDRSFEQFTTPSPEPSPDPSPAPTPDPTPEPSPVPPPVPPPSPSPYHSATIINRDTPYPVENQADVSDIPILNRFIVKLSPIQQNTKEPETEEEIMLAIINDSIIDSESKWFCLDLAVYAPVEATEFPIMFDNVQYYLSDEQKKEMKKRWREIDPDIERSVRKMQDLEYREAIYKDKGYGSEKN